MVSLESTKPRISRQTGVEGPADLVYLDKSAWNRLSKTESDADFLSGWLSLQCRMIAGTVSGVVVLGDPDQGTYVPAARWPERSETRSVLVDAVNQAIETRQGVVVRPERGDLQDTPACVIAYPILIDDQLHGLTAIEVNAQSDIALQTSIRQLQWGGSWIEGWIRKKQSVDDLTAINRLKIILDSVAECVERDGFAAACTATVTELATRLGCERVSFGLKRGAHIHVQAQSHSSTVNAKTTLVQSIARAMEESIDQGTMIAWPDEDNLQRISIAHSGLASQNQDHVSRIVTVPVTEAGEFQAAMTFELSRADANNLASVELLQCVSSLTGPVLLKARQSERFIGLKVVDSLATQLRRLFGRGFLGRKLVATLMMVAAVFFGFFETAFRVPGPAKIEGLIQRVAAAPFDGYVTVAAVRPGDKVASGELLAQLDDRDLKLERHAWTSRRDQFYKEQKRALAEHNIANARVISAQIDEADAQISLLNQKIDRTVIRAPFDSVVIDGDLSQTIGRAVRRGEPLYTLAPLDQYRLIIDIDERDIVYIKPELTGSLVLAAIPNTPLTFTVKRVTPVTKAQEGLNSFRVEAVLSNQPRQLRPGMEGVAKVLTGEELLIWIWTRKMIEWVQVKLWNWWL